MSRRFGLSLVLILGSVGLGGCSRPDPMGGRLGVGTVAETVWRGGDIPFEERRTMLRVGLGPMDDPAWLPIETRVKIVRDDARTEIPDNPMRQVVVEVEGGEQRGRVGYISRHELEPVK